MNSAPTWDDVWVSMVPVPDPAYQIKYVASVPQKIGYNTRGGNIPRSSAITWNKIARTRPRCSVRVLRFHLPRRAMPCSHEQFSAHLSCR